MVPPELHVRLMSWFAYLIIAKKKLLIKFPLFHSSLYLFLSLNCFIKFLFYIIFSKQLLSQLFHLKHWNSIIIMELIIEALK